MATATLEELKASRAISQGRMTRIHTYIEKNEDNINLSDLECRLGLLEVHYKQTLGLQDSIEAMLPGNTGEVEKGGELEELYCKVKSKILSLMSEFKRRQIADETVNNQTLFMPTPESSKLGKLRLPKFSGEYTEYPHFIQQFNSRVDSNVSLSIIDKFTYLVEECLVGEAKSVIKSLDITVSNYPKALEMLKSRYDNKCIIIQTHIRLMFMLPRVTSCTAAKLRKLVDSMDGHVRALRSLGDDKEIINAFFVYLASSKFDEETLIKWEDSLELDKLPEWHECSTFLNKRYSQHIENRDIAHKALNKTSYSSTRSNKINNNSHKFSNFTSLSVSQYTVQCTLCNANNHTIDKCKKFLNLTVMERFIKVKQLSLCLVCLVSGHSVKNCNKKRCRVCNQPHHFLLHRYSSSQSDSNSSSSLQSAGKTDNSLSSSTISSTMPSLYTTGQTSLTSGNSPQVNNTLQRSCNTAVSSKAPLSLDNNAHILLATTVVYGINKAGISVPIRVLLDSGSQINCITKYAAQLLQLDISKCNGNLGGIGDVRSTIRHKTSATIQSMHSDFQTNLDLWILPSITTYQPDIKIDINKWSIPDNIILADPNFNEPQRIDMLIGAEMFFEILSTEQFRLGIGKPILRNTLLGWVVSGSCSSGHLSTSKNSFISTCKDSTDVNDNQETSLHELVQRFWKMDEFKDQGVEVPEDEVYLEEHFLKTIAQTEEGRLIIKLPFKKSFRTEALGDSFKMAERRFLNLEKRLLNHERLKLQYIDFMREYEQLGHMEIVENHNWSLVRYVMPHHCVIKPDSSITKLRVVFDASARTSSNISLNDVLMVGPTVQEELFSIISRFRLHKVAITADISKMYRQFLVTPEDSYYQCILWRENPDKELKLYRLKTITYGTAPAPFLATRCLNFLADKYMELFPVGATVIKRDFYVDDLLTGANSREEVETIRLEVETILHSAQLELKKWYTNDTTILNKIAESDREKPIRLNDSHIIKTLGIVWEPVTDEFRFVYPFDNHHEKITKRSVLSDLSRLFDPLGIVNPVIVLSKIFMQNLWIQNLNWDTPLDKNLSEQWQTYRSQLKNLNDIRISRRIVSTDAVKCELHGFADASLRAYGCCLYTRCEDLQGNIQTNLICAKSKVAPVSTESLPRLELNAAVLLSTLVDKIVLIMGNQFEKIYLWTDSEIVLDWISDHPASWEVYIANRVSLIQQKTRNFYWRHTSSKNNPADIVSRGSLVKNLESTIWFSGPKYLRKEIDEWPQDKERNPKNVTGRRKVKNILHGTSIVQNDMVSNHKFVNNFSKLRRIFAYCLRFSNNIQLKIKGLNSSVGELTAQELDQSFLKLIWNIQQISFRNEIKILNLNLEVVNNNRRLYSQLDKSSSITKLNPFIDTSSKLQLLRVGGRLRNSLLPNDTKYPIILPKNHPFINSFITYLHFKNFHAGAQALTAISRQRFWIIDIRRTASKIVHSCIKCFRMKPKLLQQVMGDLPANRVRPTQPFYNCGVDFCGPIYTTQKIRGRSPVKSYISVFICFSTKAVHMEVVTNLSLQGFIGALKRFVARRGLCKNLYCDNATNFIGARNELAQFRNTFYSKEATDQLISTCAELAIEFHHIPPRSPHFGGLWEAAVKSAKHLLLKTLGNNILTFEELCTVTAQIEAVLNSRPLTAMSSDPSDDTALPPGHFLIGRPMNALPELDISTSKISNLKQWQTVCALQQKFWKRWSAEYITQLQHRYKWNSISENVQVGTLVLIHEDNTAPQNWRLGRIIETIPGEDGYVRVVNIHTKNGILKRCFNKIAPLPLASN